jgi:hypothetical protein
MISDTATRTDYADYSTDELLDALEWAGRYSDLDLLRECMQRPEELTPGLLEMLKVSDENDAIPIGSPQWFRQIHAGRLLVAYREPDAIPLFAERLRDPASDTFLEWFDAHLHAWGPEAIPTWVDVMQDEDAPRYGRSLSSGALRWTAQQHPEERERILEALRAELPVLSPSGRLKVSRTTTEKQVEHWTWVVSALAELGDEKSRERIEAMFEEEWIEEMIIGDVQDYRSILHEDPREPPELDILADYERLLTRAVDDRATSDSDTAMPTGRARTLVERLEIAGHPLPPEIVEECLQYRDEITPRLLQILREDLEEIGDRDQWDNPRWHRSIHASLLLIQFREEEAIPLVTRLVGSGAEYLVDVVGNKLSLFGPPAVPALADVLHDRSASAWGRDQASGSLSRIAWEHDEAREPAVTALRDTLPPLREPDDGDGPALALPDDTDEDDAFVWTCVAYELARLDDETILPQVEALDEHDLLDPMMMADVVEFKEFLYDDPPYLEFNSISFDVVDYYASQYEDLREEAKSTAVQEREEHANESPQRWTSESSYDTGWSFGTSPEKQDSASKGGHYEGGTFVRDEEKVGRNDPCPCGSGRKYKHCCG